MRLTAACRGRSSAGDSDTLKSRTSRSSSGFLFDSDEDLAAASKQREWEACLSERVVQIKHAHI